MNKSNVEITVIIILLDFIYIVYSSIIDKIIDIKYIDKMYFGDFSSCFFNIFVCSFCISSFFPCDIR